MILSRKLAAALLLIPVGFIVAFLVSVLGAYGSFSDIPHYDVTMWIFNAVFGILILLFFIGIALVVLSFPEVPEPKDDGSYPEISELLATQYNDEIQEGPMEEQTEEEAPEELQTEEEALEIEVPEISEMSIDDQEPQEQKDRKASEIQPPAIWGEEKFE